MPCKHNMGNKSFYIYLSAFNCGTFLPHTLTYQQACFSFLVEKFDTVMHLGNFALSLDP